MLNDNKDIKNEELCEGKQKLTQEDIEQVTDGAKGNIMDMAVGVIIGAEF